MSSPCPTATSGPLPALIASGILAAMSPQVIVLLSTMMFLWVLLNSEISLGTSVVAAPPVQPFQKEIVTFGPVYVPLATAPPPDVPPPPPLHPASAMAVPMAATAARPRTIIFFLL